VWQRGRVKPIELRRRSADILSALSTQCESACKTEDLKEPERVAPARGQDVRAPFSKQLVKSGDALGAGASLHQGNGDLGCDPGRTISSQNGIQVTNRRRLVLIHNAFNYQRNVR
jgi:hypothetical protein